MKLTGELPIGTTATDLVLPGHPDAPEEGRGGQVRGVLRSRALHARPRRPGHDRQHGAGVRRHDGLLPGGRRDAPLPRADRARSRTSSSGSSGTARSSGSSAPTRRPTRSSPPRSSSTWAASCRASPGRSGRRTWCRWPTLKRNFVVNLPSLMSPGCRPPRSELAEAAYSRWMNEGGASVTIGEHGAEAPPRSIPSAADRVRRARRRRHQPARRRGGHRRDHQLHQHLEPVGHDRRRPAGARRPSSGASDQALGQDQSGPGIASGDRLPARARACSPTSSSCGSTRWGTAAPPASATAVRCPSAIAQLIEEHSLVTAAVLSGNRNFEARVHPQVRANYLASPMLVVAFALAGRVDIDLTTRAAGHRQGRAAGLPRGHLADLRRSASTRWRPSLKPELFGAALRIGLRRRRGWQRSRCPRGAGSPGIERSTYVQEPPFFRDLPAEPPAAHATSRRAGARRARRLGDDRPHLARRARSPRTARPRATCSSTASSRRTGTPSGPGGATTK